MTVQMTPIWLYNHYRNLYEGRRFPSRPYVSLRSSMGIHAIIMIREDVIYALDYYSKNQAENLSTEEIKQRAFGEIRPDGFARIPAKALRYMCWSSTYKFLSNFFDGQFALLPNRGIKSNADRYIQTMDCPAPYPVKGDLIINPQGIYGCTEPVKFRIWNKEERREYLRKIRTIRKQLKLRVQVGAVQDLIKEHATFVRYSNDRTRWNRPEKIEHAVNDVIHLSADEQQLYESIALAGNWGVDAEAVDNPDFVIDKAQKVIEQGKERIRKAMNAVVYS